MFCDRHDVLPRMYLSVFDSWFAHLEYSMYSVMFFRAEALFSALVGYNDLIWETEVVDVARCCSHVSERTHPTPISGRLSLAAQNRRVVVTRRIPPNPHTLPRC